jgi:hypothetical protein
MSYDSPTFRPAIGMSNFFASSHLTLSTSLDDSIYFKDVPSYDMCICTQIYVFPDITLMNILF